MFWLRTWTWWPLEIPSNLNYSDHFLLKSSTIFMIPGVLGSPVEVTWYLSAYFCIISSSPSLRWLMCSQKYVSSGKKKKSLFPQILNWCWFLFATGTNCLWSVSAAHGSRKKIHENLQNKSKISSLDMPTACLWQNLQHINHQSLLLTSQLPRGCENFLVQLSGAFQPWILPSFSFTFHEKLHIRAITHLNTYRT